MCECPLCHELFSGETTFVQHRVNGKVTGQPGAWFLGPCQDPAAKGLMLNEHGVWSRPSRTCSGTEDGRQGILGCPRVDPSPGPVSEAA